MARRAARDQLVFFLSLVILLVSLNACCTRSQYLTANFYSKTCPNLPTIVRNVTAQAVQKEARLAASILRLFFHDCFVQGCDASILLDDTPSFKGEKTANPNINSVRGFEVIDSIKTQVEAACKGVVSCADILALAARDSVVLSYGPSWTVLLGRRDSTTASLTGANNNLPSPASNLSQLITKFQAQGLSVQDLVASSGAHTIGQARCVTFRARLYNQSGSGAPDPTLNATYRAQLAARCPASGGDNNLAPLDVHTPTTFDAHYYANLASQMGLLNSDQVLYSTPGSSTHPIVTAFASNQSAFFDAFTTAMIRMGNLHPLTGTQGQIRANCRSIN